MKRPTVPEVKQAEWNAHPIDAFIAAEHEARGLAPRPEASRAVLLRRETWMQDTVNHTTQAFLGLTVGCARCHDHMYDTISQEEYYRLRANFEPHQVRLDRVPSEADTTKDGLARVFDADLAVATYLFRKGDDRDPDKDKPLRRSEKRRAFIHHSGAVHV